ncbi:MAG: ClpX C4-type zinc finger protein [Bryobacteraceae bacterium]|jgi:ATP-dependent Clp protease ATP-binding subunit ClpX
MAKDDDALRCSFCHKSQSDGAMLISNPAATACICHECIETCHSILERQQAGLPQVTHPAHLKENSN